MGEYGRLAVRSLRKRKLRSWLTMVGVLIGIAAVVSLIGLGEGLRAAVIGQFNILNVDIITVQASGLHAGPPGAGVVNPLKEKYIEKIEHVAGVDVAIPRLIESITLRFNGGVDATFAGSVPAGEKRDELLKIASFEMDKGRMLKDKDRLKVVVGSSYASGEHFGKAITTGERVVIGGKEFDVIGTLKKKGSFIVDHVVLMNEDVMREVFENDNDIDLIAVRADPGADVKSVSEKIENVLRRERDVKKGEEDFTVETSQQQLQDVDAAVFAVQMFVYVIAAISIVVGGLGIMNTMYTSVLERTKEIGVMKAIGAKNRDIFMMFFMEAGMIGLLGGIAGIIIGMGLAYGLSALGRSALNSDLIGAEIKASMIGGALLFSFVIGVVSGVLPAYRASLLKPIDALRAVK